MTALAPGQRPFSATRRRWLAGAGASALLGAGCATTPPRARAERFAAFEHDEYVIRGAHVLSMDPTVGDIAGGSIHVRGGVITAVDAGSRPGPPGLPVFDATGMIAIPGFVDTHWHMWGAIARNLAGEDATTGYFPNSRALGSLFSAEDNARGVRLALAEAIAGGITTVHNWSHNLLEPAYADAEIAAHRQARSRARFAYGYSRKSKGNDPLPMDDVARLQRQVFTVPAGADRGLLTLGIANMGPEANAIELCRQEWAAARRLGLPITTHMGIAPRRPGVAPIDGIGLLRANGLLGPDVLLVHATNNTPADFDILAATGTPVSLSPYTEMRTGFGFPPVLQMLKAGVVVSLSIDTTMLAGNADMFAIMKAVQNVADGAALSEFALTPKRVLEMATLGGARALGLDGQVGSLTPGKRADIVLLRTDHINMAPLTNPARMVVQAAQPRNIDAVIVDGKPLMTGGRLTTLDVSRIMADAQDSIDRVLRAAGGADGGGRR